MGTPEPSEADPDAEEDGESGDHADQDGDHKRNGKGPGGDSPGDDTGVQNATSPTSQISPKESAKNNSSHNNQSNTPPKNSHTATPHLLDAPLLQGATSQLPDQTPALVILESKSSPKTASIGDPNNQSEVIEEIPLQVRTNRSLNSLLDY